MTHQDRINLIRDGVINKTGYWADLGSGDGLFTAALAEILEPPAKVFSIDKDFAALKKQRDWLKVQYRDIVSYFIAAGFENELPLPPLDGVLMANALHYIREKSMFLKRIRKLVKPAATFILVEYNTHISNQWVPFPLTFLEWKILTRNAGYQNTRLLRTQPSIYHKEIYSALTFLKTE
jgi:SAM-dependent methyltransferase